MRSLVLVVLLRLAAAAGIAASMVLTLDYANKAGFAFCSIGSGCLAVRRWSVENLGGISLPQIGLLLFVTLLALSLSARTRPFHGLVAATGALAGLGGFAFLAVQAFLVGAFCKWCVVVDMAALFAAITSALIYLDARRGAFVLPRGDLPVTLVWVFAALLPSIVLPLVWARFPETPATPPEVRERFVPGKVNIVSFTDFECPFCREYHAFVARSEQEHGEKIHVTRLMMPLDRHPGAMPAALAYKCTTDEALKKPMADRLYGAKPRELTRDGTVRIARKVLAEDKASPGVADTWIGVFETCIDDAGTRESVEKDRELFRRIGGFGVPLTYVQDHFAGGTGTFPSALDLALSGKKKATLPVFALMVLLAALYASAALLTTKLAWGHASPTKTS